MSHTKKVVTLFVSLAHNVTLAVLCFTLLSSAALANNQTYSTNGTYTWTVPPGVTHVQVECWGPGGNGGSNGGPVAGGGGGGGAYARRYSYTVTPGGNYTVVVGIAANYWNSTPAAQTTFDSTGCVADFGQDGGANGYQGNGGPGGQAAASIGDVTTSGTAGGQGFYAGSAGTGGAGANGGAGGNPNNNGSGPGGGGGGSGVSWSAPGNGADGQVVITWTPATVATPTFSPAAGTYTTGQTVTISTTTSGATIRYTTDGTTPSETAGTVYSGALSVSVSQTIKAIAYATSMTDSAVASGVFTITGTVAAPSFSPSGGTYTSAQSVTLSSTTSGASIRYTTDGSTPSETAGTLYSGPVSLGLNSTTTVKAMAYLSGWLDSSVASATYTITGTVGAPTFNPVAGTYQTSQSIALSSTNSGATIRYTTDGSAPTETHGTVYSSAIHLNTTPNVATVTTIKAIGYQSTWLDSAVSSATYTITGTVSMPVFSPPPGTYTAQQSITITTATGGSTIRYTTDGSAPSETHGTQYTGPVPLSAQFTTLQAIAYQAGWTDSTVASGSYIYTGATGGGGTGGPGNGNPNGDSGNGMDPRRVGVRAFGAYWGAAGEQIDTTSGNLNFALPIIKIASRGNWSIGAMLNYNSQMWRQDSAGTWLMGYDVGYGLGWQVQIGSLVPVWANSQVDHYIYTDATGAEYKLSVNTGGVWTSAEGTNISYDSNTNRIYATDGSFRVMGSISAAGEQDAGTYYPTQIEDPNGNYIAIQYAVGTGSAFTNSSARIQYIYDPRVSNDFNGLQGPSYIFTYNSDQIPHLISIGGLPGESYTFSVSSQNLYSPFDGTQFGTASVLSSLQVTGEAPLPGPHSFTYDTSGQMTKVVTPLGGQLTWSYGSCSYTGPVKQMEVVSRSTNAITDSWTFTPDSCAGTVAYHATMTLTDTAIGTSKVYTSGSPIANYVMPTAYDEVNSDTTRNLHKDFGWTQDGYGNIYMNSVTTTLNPGTGAAIQTKSVQTLDAYGNLTQSQVYDYGNLSTPARTYNSTYMSDPNYVSRHIVNKVVQSTVTTASGTVNLVYVNYYDGYRPIGPTQPPYCGSNNVTPPGLPSMHDTNYNSSFNYRGNLTYTVTYGGTYCYDYYQGTGVPADASDITGNTVTTSPSSNSNYSLPGVLTPNGNSNLATTVSYAGSWAVSSVTAPNGATSNTIYDSIGRPASSTSSDGAVTNYSYSYGTSNYQTATITTGSSSQWKKTYLDGFGRTIVVQTGHDGTTVNEVDTPYSACACSPLGKVAKVSLPYDPNSQSPVWTVYSYDGSGRTLTILKPDGASKTTISYSGNTTTTTDPAGKWKTNTTDAFGNLTSVTEPDPNTQNGTLVTSYTYNSTNQLVQVTMPRANGTQTRTFSWAGTDLASTTNPENGTVSYQYDGAHHVTLRTDAKGQQTKYAYDVNGRLSAVTHATSASQMNGATPDVNYYYDTNPFNSGYSQNAYGRLAAISFAGMNLNWTTFGQNGQNNWNTTTPLYEYSYNQAGRVIDQHFQISQVWGPIDSNGDSSTAVTDFDAAYTWDNQGRMTARNGPDANYSYSYDSMGRLSTMSGGASATAQYNSAGQITSMSYDSFTETRTYNTLQQLTRMTTANYNGNVMDMQYAYSATQNNGRITSSTDGVTGEIVNYTYDILNRLSGAGSSSGSWSQTYSYDGFGNLTGMQGAAVTSYNPATNQDVTLSYDADGLFTGSGYQWDVENRLIASNIPVNTNYAYDPNNKRVFQVVPSTTNSQPVVQAYFYSITGQKLATIQCGSGCSLLSANVYFGSKMIRSNGVTVATDRLGSVRANSNGEQMNYLPYGQERTSTANGREKFATYIRDGANQDYADQRYYNQAGAFWSPDPGGISTAKPSEPWSWNRYAYVGGDPINFLDPRGRLRCADPGCDDPPGPSPMPGGYTPDGGDTGAGGGNLGSDFPNCNAASNPNVEAKLVFLANTMDAALSQAAQIVSAADKMSSTVNVDTNAVAYMLLQWSAGEGGYMTNPRVQAENNYFGFQNNSTWGGLTVQCPASVGYTTNACFAQSTTFGQELSAALNSTSGKTGQTYLSALEAALAGGASSAGALQAIANNGWNGSGTYGYDKTQNPSKAPGFLAQFDCMLANPGYYK